MTSGDPEMDSTHVPRLTIGNMSAINLMQNIRNDQMEVSALVEEADDANVTIMNAEASIIEERSVYLMSKWSKKVPSLESAYEDIERMKDHLDRFPKYSSVTEGKLHECFKFREKRIESLMNEMSFIANTMTITTNSFTTSTPMITKPRLLSKPDVSMILSEELCSLNLNETLKEAAPTLPISSSSKAKFSRSLALQQPAAKFNPNLLYYFFL